MSVAICSEYVLARIVVPWQCAVVLLFTWMYVVMGRLGRLVAIVAFRSGLYLGRPCLGVINTPNDFFAALPGALWRLPILGLLSESLK